MVIFHVRKPTAAGVHRPLTERAVRLLTCPMWSGIHLVQGPAIRRRVRFFLTVV